MKALLKVALALWFIGLVALAFLLVRGSKPGSSSSVPTPDGYNDLLSAGRMLSAEPAQVDDLSTNELASVVNGNADALRLARSGLQKACRVPLEHSEAYLSNHVADLTAFKRLTRAFIAEGKLAERQGRTGQAASVYLDAIHFGHECGRGGVMIDALVGMASRSIGCQSMQGLLSRLEAPDCRTSIRRVENMDGQAQSAAEVLNQEKSWRRRAFGLRGQLLKLVTWRRLKQTEQKLVTKLQAQHRAERLLLIGLADRAYELDNGKAATKTADLAPGYLKTWPQDPLTGTHMKLP